MIRLMRKRVAQERKREETNGCPLAANGREGGGGGIAAVLAERGKRTGLRASDGEEVSRRPWIMVLPGGEKKSMCCSRLFHEGAEEEERLGFV